MKIRLKKFVSTRGILVFAFAWLAASPVARAVVPPPDGGYANFTTAEGTNALLNLTSGAGNTGIGWYSLFSGGAANFNTAVGAGTLALNGADSNTAVGTAAMLFNTTGDLNTAVGTQALFANTEGTSNTAVGYATLISNTTGGFNTAAGELALLGNTSGRENAAYGASTLSANTEGSFNTAIGVGALNNNTTGASNTAVGNGAGLSITGDGNVCIGALVLGAAGLNDTTWIRNINTTPQSFVANTNNYVTVRMTDGRLGFTTIVSSRRYKEDIKPMGQASESLLALKPVTFRLKGQFDPSRRPQWGLIAEEVEQVNPDLVDRNNKGQPESVRYDMVNAMLLNEFLKEHKTVREQGATIAQLKKDFQATVAELTQRLDEQAAQIQKVNARLEASRPTPQVVQNDQ